MQAGESDTSESQNAYASGNGGLGAIMGSPESQPRPRIVVRGAVPENAAYVQPPPQSPQSPPGSPITSRARINASQGSFRRHGRKRSSTIYVAPIHTSKPAVTESTPGAAGLLKGVTSLAGAQFLAKIIAFALNQVLFRFLSARELGEAARLDFVMATALSLSRDAVRLAAQRRAGTRAEHESEYTPDGRPILGTLAGSLQETVNLGWCSSAAGLVVVSIIVGALVWSGSWPQGPALVAILAAVLELVGEPPFLIAQQRLQLGLRARAESCAAVVRAAIVAVLVAALHVPAFLSFAFGQVAYTATRSGLLYAGSSGSICGFALYPVRIWTDQHQQKLVFVGSTARRAVGELEMQQVLKLAVTEADSLAISTMATLEEQGEYAVASNYGALLVRLVFFPVEEALRGYFARSAAAGDGNDVLHDQRTVFASVLRIYSYLAILATGFGPLVTGYVMSIVLSRTLAGAASQVLGIYVFYLPLLAWNGALEALVQSVAPLNVIRAQGFALWIIGVVFMVVVYLLVAGLHFGSVGLVYAQLLATLLRLGWALQFAVGHFGGSSWLPDCFPSWPVLVVSALSASVARFGTGTVHTFKQFTAVVCLAGLVVGVAALTERARIQALYKTLRKDKAE